MPTKFPNSEQISIYFPKWLLGAIDKVASQEQVSRAEYIRQATMEALEVPAELRRRSRGPNRPMKWDSQLSEEPTDET